MKENREKDIILFAENIGQKSHVNIYPYFKNTFKGLGI